MMRKYALITGASGGIGRAIARKLASEGYHLYLHYYQNELAIQELLMELNEFGGEYIPIQANLAKNEGIEALARQILSIDVIIHNAGNSLYGLLIDLNDEEAEQLIHMHVTTPLLLTKRLLPKLLSKNSGNIIVISSIWGQAGASCEVAYSTAKGAQIAFVKALSKEVALNGIRVNAVAPGAVKTSMLSDFSEEELAVIAGEIPMGKIASPENIADGVSFLISDKASYITGQTLAINGGWYV